MQRVALPQAAASDPDAKVVESAWRMLCEWPSPDAIPEQKPETQRYLELHEKLAGIAATNPLAALLLRVHSPQGQAFLDTAVRVLQKPGTQ